MESTPAWIAVPGAVMLALAACSAAGPTQVRDEPALRFSGPVDAGSGSCDEQAAPSRVRRDAYGRPIHFREIPMDRHGVDRHGAMRAGVACGERDGCAQGRSRARRGGGCR